MALPCLAIDPLADLLVDRMDTRQSLIFSNLCRGAGSALQTLAPGALSARANSTSHAINQAS